MLNRQVVHEVSQEIFRRFPEFRGVRPQVRDQGNGAYLLTFHTKASLPGNKALPQWVRAVVNDQGKILKVSTSH
jgi:hypothetical protein